MAAQWEGPIVDSLWEAFVISWHADIAPLNCTNDSAALHKSCTFAETSFDKLLTDDGKFRLPEQSAVDRSLQEHVGGNPHWDMDLAGEMHRLNTTLTPQGEQTEPELVAKHLSKRFVEPSQSFADK